MKIQVRRPDSRIEILTLTEPLTLDRCDCGTNTLTTATGMIHCFNSLGEYDGFGVEQGKYTEEEVREFLRQYDSEREILPEEEGEV